MDSRSGLHGISDGWIRWLKMAGRANIEDSMKNAVRKLGSIETRMALFHSELSGSTQGTQVIRFTANLTHSLLQAAVSQLYHVYEPLQCSIKKHGDTLWFFNDVELVDVPILYSAVNSEMDLHQLVTHAVDSLLDAERSLWRMNLVSLGDGDTHVLIFTAHHAIIDANGMHEIADTFFKIIGAMVTGSALPKLEHCALPLPVDDLLQSGVAPAPTATPEARLHDAPCPVTHRRTAWQMVELTGKQLDALNAALTKDNLKLHSIVSSALSQAMYEAGVVTSEFNFGTAVTLRFLQHANPTYHNPLGCYMSIASNTVDPTEKNLKVLAKKYDRELMRTIMTTCLQRVDTRYADFKNVVKRIAEEPSFLQGAGITNMAKVGVERHYPGVEVIQYMMLANRVSANFSIVAHCYEFADKQHIALVYPTPSLSSSVASAVADRLREKLLHYSRGNELALTDDAQPVAC